MKLNNTLDMQDTFKWTDELVLDFAKVVTEGSYGEYDGCKSAKSKMEKFKEIHLESRHKNVTATKNRTNHKFGKNNPADVLSYEECLEKCNGDVLQAINLWFGLRMTFRKILILKYIGSHGDKYVRRRTIAEYYAQYMKWENVNLGAVNQVIDRLLECGILSKSRSGRVRVNHIFREKHPEFFKINNDEK